MRYYISIEKISDIGSFDYKGVLCIKEDTQPFLLSQPIEITVFGDTKKQTEEKIASVLQKLRNLK
jgi:hypothetical protein